VVLGIHSNVDDLRYLCQLLCDCLYGLLGAPIKYIYIYMIYQNCPSQRLSFIRKKFIW
jgi:hypothetical protein